MTLREMEYLIAVAQEGNLSAAAKRLHVSQPTLSVFLTGLENRIGLKLFSYEKRRMIPTEAGKICLEASQRILQIRAQTEHSIYRSIHSKTEHIVLGVSPLRGSVLAGTLYLPFLQRYPEAEFEIREAYKEDLDRYLREGKVSMILQTRPSNQPESPDEISYATEEIVLGISRMHPLASLAESAGEEDRVMPCGDPSLKLPVADLMRFADAPFVLLPSGVPARVLADEIFSEAGIHPTIVFETSNNLLLCQMIANGVGAGIGPLSIFQNYAPGSIVCFALRPAKSLRLGVRFAPGHVLTEAERYLIYLAMQETAGIRYYRQEPDAGAVAIMEEFTGTDEKIRNDGRNGNGYADS